MEGKGGCVCVCVWGVKQRWQDDADLFICLFVLCLSGCVCMFVQTCA